MIRPPRLAQVIDNARMRTLKRAGASVTRTDSSWKAYAHLYSVNASNKVVEQGSFLSLLIQERERRTSANICNFDPKLVNVKT